MLDHYMRPRRRRATRSAADLGAGGAGAGPGLDRRRTALAPRPSIASNSPVRCSGGKQTWQKVRPKSVRWTLRRVTWPRKTLPPARPQRLDHLGLRLDHLVGQLVLERVAADRDEAVADEVVEVGGDELAVQAAGLVADHREPPGDLPRADPEGRGLVDVDDPLRPVVDEQLQDPGLVGRELVDDPGEAGVDRVARRPRRRPRARAARRRARAGTAPLGLAAAPRALRAREPADAASAATPSHACRGSARARRRSRRPPDRAAAARGDSAASPSRSAAFSAVPTPQAAPRYQAPAAIRATAGHAVQPGQQLALLRPRPRERRSATASATSRPARGAGSCRRRTSGSPRSARSGAASSAARPARRRSAISSSSVTSLVGDDDERLRDLAGLLVGDADHGAVGDAPGG